MKINKVIGCCIALAFATSCSEDLGTSNIIIPEFNYDELSETDKFIYDELTVPFNVTVEYKWNMGNLVVDDMRKDIVPPKEEKVVPFLKAIKAVWIDTYIEETAISNPTFLKEHTPKVFLLNGCPSYNDDGTTTEGMAEGGRQVILYSVNDFVGSRADLLSYAHVMHHEFAHILHQTVLYNERFKNITPGYSSTWYLVPDKQALASGFITPYASSNSDEDFAEMVSQMLTHTSEEWNKIIEGAGNATAVANLREKESIVVNYMHDAWGVEMESLQKRVMEAINNHSK